MAGTLPGNFILFRPKNGSAGSWVVKSYTTDPAVHRVTLGNIMDSGNPGEYIAFRMGEASTRRIIVEEITE